MVFERKNLKKKLSCVLNETHASLKKIFKEKLAKQNSVVKRKWFV